MSGGSALRRELDNKTFREMEQMMKDIEKEALKKMAQEYPEGVMLIIRHGLEERKAIVCDHSKYEMKIRVQGKTGKYWIDSHRIIKAVCPKCESEEWATTGANVSFALPEADYELCHDCGHQWGHR